MPQPTPTDGSWSDIFKSFAWPLSLQRRHTTNKVLFVLRCFDLIWPLLEFCVPSFLAWLYVDSPLIWILAAISAPAASSSAASGLCSTDFFLIFSFVRFIKFRDFDSATRDFD